MGWFALIGLALKFLIPIVNMLKDKQLIDGGKAEAIVEGMHYVVAMVDDAAKGAAGMQFDTEWSRKVKEKYRRS